jgi:hypothetical protein
VTTSNQAKLRKLGTRTAVREPTIDCPVRSLDWANAHTVGKDAVRAGVSRPQQNVGLLSHGGVTEGATGYANRPPAIIAPSVTPSSPEAER